MEIDEFRKHVASKELLKIVQHLNDSKHHLIKSVERIKLIGSNNPATEAIEQNIDALTEGLLETIKMVSYARQAFIDDMQEPTAEPLKNQGSLRIYATPFQRALMREGVVFPPTLPLYIPTKTEQRAPRIIPFHLTTRRHNRRKGKDYIPL
jgi:hypothetical protein